MIYDPLLGIIVAGGIFGLIVLVIGIFSAGSQAVKARTEQDPIQKEKMNSEVVWLAFGPVVFLIIVVVLFLLYVSSLHISG